MAFTYPYPRPSLTCDVVALTMQAEDLAVLLIRRQRAPFKGHWALPGGFVDENESLERAALRELSEETGLSSAKLEQIGAYGDPGRDPRGHTVTVAWLTYLSTEPKVSAGDDASEAAWHPLRSVLRTGKRRPAKKVELAFDHDRIIADGFRRLCQHLDHPTAGRKVDLLPPRFTLAEVQRVYEIVLGEPLSTRAFRKRLLDFGLVVPAAARPAKATAARLYKWNRR